MRAATGIDDFVRAPRGKYVAGRAFLYCSPADGVFAQILWGRPQRDDVERLTSAYAAELRAPHVSLFDASRLESVDHAAYESFSRYMASNGHAFRDRVTRQALVRPAGLPGMIVAGFYAVMPQPYPHRVFKERGEALEWLGRDDALEIGRALDGLLAEIQGVDPATRAVRDLLAASARATIDDVARALGTTGRTLQRRLRDAGTSFRAEQQSAQMEKAQSLLRDTDLKLTAIALEVGCASLQHFSTQFRKATGESPSAWRARHR